MPEISFDLSDYQANVYLKLLRQLTEGLPSIQASIAEAEALRDPGRIDSLTDYYTKLFSTSLAAKHLRFEITRVYKPLFLGNPGPFDKYNSYHHIVLQVASLSLLKLDELYGGQLSRVLKLYQHTFAKINNFYVDFESTQLAKYTDLLEKVSTEISVFLENTAYREVLASKEKLKDQHLSRIPFGALFNVAPIQNLSGILQHGILSHNGAHNNGMVRTDISNPSVNSRRNRIEASLGTNLHDYAPMFINPRNATFYYWCHNKPRTDVILLKINPNILLEKDIAFSDGNAAVTGTRFYKDIEDFNRLDWLVIKQEYWTTHPDGKRIKCAEVLAKDYIPLHYIDEIYVYDQNALDQVLPLFPNHLSITIRVDPGFYF
jgi:hypothetical protein